jgi:hypothetical protein
MMILFVLPPAIARPWRRGLADFCTGLLMMSMSGVNGSCFVTILSLFGLDAFPSHAWASRFSYVVRPFSNELETADQII